MNSALVVQSESHFHKLDMYHIFGSLQYERHTEVTQPELKISDVVCFLLFTQPHKRHTCVTDDVHLLCKT